MFENKIKEDSRKKQNIKSNASPLNRDVWHFIVLSPDMNRPWMDGSRKRVWRHIEGSLDDGVGASEANPTGKLLQQARDGTGGAGCRGLEAHGGAVGRQEDFPHRFQTGLTLWGERTPGEEKEGGVETRGDDDDDEKTGRKRLGAEIFF